MSIDTIGQNANYIVNHEDNIMNYSFSILISALLSLNILIFTTHSKASDADHERMVYANMAHEAGECIAYYEIVINGLENSNQPDLAQKFQEVREHVIAWALILAEASNIKFETIEAVVRQQLRIQTEEIDGDVANIAILTEKYAYLCRDVIDKPEDRLRYWMAATPR